MRDILFLGHSIVDAPQRVTQGQGNACTLPSVEPKRSRGIGVQCQASMFISFVYLNIKSLRLAQTVYRYDTTVMHKDCCKIMALDEEGGKKRVGVK